MGRKRKALKAVPGLPEKTGQIGKASRKKMERNRGGDQGIVLIEAKPTESRLPPESEFQFVHCSKDGVLTESTAFSAGYGSFEFYDILDDVDDRLSSNSEVPHSPIPGIQVEFRPHDSMSHFIFFLKRPTQLEAGDIFAGVICSDEATPEEEQVAWETMQMLHLQTHGKLLAEKPQKKPWVAVKSDSRTIVNLVVESIETGLVPPPTEMMGATRERTHELLDALCGDVSGALDSYAVFLAYLLLNSKCVAPDGVASN
jgi:hypothetical protein